jgi:hypothetical protein
LIPRILSVVVLLLAPLWLAGCQSGPDPTVEVIRAALFPSQPSGAGLDPRFTYLRVTGRQRVVFFVLGSVDPHPQGGIEVWYSGDREALRLQNGRVVGLSGSLTEWRQVRLPVLPSWAELLVREAPLRWERNRDVMPGYRFNLMDQLQLQPVAAPGKSALVGVDAAGLRWFEERMIATSAGADPLPPARYALQGVQGEATVLYGEQCISLDFCITWQRWKPQP